MSRICYYARIAEDGLDAVARHPDGLFAAPETLPAGTEVIDIDKAHDALAWLVSPLKRAEALHMTRLITEPNWPDEDARASVARLAATPVDDALAAIEGRDGTRLDALDLGGGPAALFAPRDVQRLAAAVAGIDASALGRAADFAAMDAHDVQPGYWLDEGDDLLATYLVPALGKLQAFYGAAVQAGQAVVIAWA